MAGRGAMDASAASTGLAVQASTAAPRGIIRYPRAAEDATSDATRPTTPARADGRPGASRALVLKAWVAVASHGVQQSALRRLIGEASAGCHPTSAALLEQLHAMHVAALKRYRGHRAVVIDLGKAKKRPWQRKQELLMQLLGGEEAYRRYHPAA